MAHKIFVFDSEKRDNTRLTSGTFAKFLTKKITDLYVLKIYFNKG